MKSRLCPLLATLCLAVLIAALLPTPAASAATDINTDTYYYEHLNERQQYFYNWLKDYYDGLSDKPATYKVDLVHMLPTKPTQQDYSKLNDDISYADMALKEDNPLYLWKGIIAGCSNASTDDERYFNLNIERTQIPTADTQKRVDARIKQIVATVGSGDRYTQLRKLVDFLIRNTFYDPYLDCINGEGHHSYALATRGHFYNQSVYGLLLEGVAVCDGYTQSLKVLCEALDIPCIIMANEGHAWNLVQMEDGKWYRIDLTQICRHIWTEEQSQTIIDTYFRDMFLNNSAVDHQNPRNLVLNGVALVTQFPEHATKQYQYTGSTTDFSYTVAASTYTPGNPKFIYRVNDDGKTCTITDYEGKESGDLTIPGKLDGYTVTAIDGYAFYYRSGFTGKLTIPDSVGSIGKGAFAGCYNLTSVKLPANLHKLGQGAFIGCKSLPEVVLPDLVDEVADFAFCDCNALASVTFGSHIQTVGIRAFDQIKSGAAINAPANSAAQQAASDAGLTFRSNGTLCTMQDADGKWEFEGNHHYHTCKHGAHFDQTQHTGMYCGWKCPDCSAEYCGRTDVYRESVITVVNAQPAGCNSLEYTGDKMCVCGNVIETGDWVGKPTGVHTPADDSWQHDDWTHWQTCACGEHLNQNSHTGGTATATQRAKCSTCGVEYGELNSTNTGPAQDNGNSGGNSSGGSSSGGNTSGGSASGGNTSGGNTSGGNTSGGDHSGGNTSGGDSSGGNTSQDPTSGNEPTLEPSAPTPTDGAAEQTPKSPVLGIVLGIVLVGLAGVGGWFGYQYYRKKHSKEP